MIPPRNYLRRIHPPMEFLFYASIRISDRGMFRPINLRFQSFIRGAAVPSDHVPAGIR